MTAELGECNGVVEGCRTETEEVEVHAIPKPLHEENLKLNEDKVGVSGGGSESSVDDDEVFPGGAQCEAELSNATVDVGDHAPQLPVEDHELEIRDEGHSPECLLSHNEAVDDELVENGETDWQLRVSVDGHPGIELHDSANKPTKKVEVPCLVDRDDGVENYFVGNKVELPCLVNGDDKVEGDLVENKPELPCFLNGEERAERDLVGNNLESPRLGKGEETVERDLVGDKLESLCFINGEDGAERNYMGNNELEQRSHLVAEVQEIDSPELVIGNDEKSEQCFSNEQNQANDELEETNSMVSEENCECQSQNLENGDDACGHAIDEGKQHESLFVLNADKGPELECVVDKSTDFESHIVVTDNDEIERECLPDGNNEMEAQFDVIVHKELESGCFVDENNGILTEDLDEQQVEEVHHGKNEISDQESSDCNRTNTGGLSDVLDKNSGGYNVTVIADMQEDTAVSAADCVSVGVPDSSNGLFTPVSGNEQKPEAEVPKKLFYCLVRIPRHVDNKIRAQIRLAQLQLDDKTQSRDFIRAAIQMKRVSREQIIERLKAARQEEKAFRDAIKSKRQEMEPVQSTLNRMKNATSVEEYDDKIYQMQYRIEHESMPLREEKQMLRDMKQLKVSRDQLCAIAGPHSELQEAFIHIDKIQERSKLLGQELDSLRKQAFQAEKNLQAIEKELDALNIDSRQLQEQWAAADTVRQEAYEALKSLKKQEYDRNYEFYRCKDDNKAARQYANRHNREALDKLCSNQVERIMEIWNKNVEFRKEYVKDNERSILKRLETLDGRSLGPDEEPPLPTNYSDDLYPSLQPQGKPSASGIRSTTEAQPMTIAQQSNQMESKANRQQNSSNEVAVPQKKAVGRSKKSQPESSPLIPEIESYEVSPVPLKVKEEDLAKKEEEAAKVKERIRQEEMRKAKEAEERKRRQTEKAHAKALARAEKETERKEKEKQKKANKKAAAAAAAATNTAGNDTAFSLDKVESGASSHDFKSSPVELKELTPETQKLAVSQRKKSVSQKVKPKSVFPAAKKGRKGLQTWMWVLLAVCFCLAALLLFFYF